MALGGGGLVSSSNKRVKADDMLWQRRVQLF